MCTLLMIISLWCLCELPFVSWTTPTGITQHGCGLLLFHLELQLPWYSQLQNHSKSKLRRLKILLSFPVKEPYPVDICVGGISYYDDSGRGRCKCDENYEQFQGYCFQIFNLCSMSNCSHVSSIFDWRLCVSLSKHCFLAQSILQSQCTCTL